MYKRQVPVGLTKHRNGLPNLPRVTAEYARSFIPIGKQLNTKYRHEDGQNFVFLSDEWFLRVGAAFPNQKYYAGHNLRENGVGQVVHFMADWQENIADYSSGLDKLTSITIGTGTLIADYFNTNFIPLLNTVSNLDVQLKPIKNTFFGEDNVTVSGWLTSQDIIAQLAEQDLGDMVLFSNRILNEDDTLTLDDMTPVSYTHLTLPTKA